MKRSGLLGSRLCSECVTPEPAVMNWTAPRPRVSDVPIESAWVRLPWTTYVQISASRCGCAPKPRAGWT